LADDLYPPLVGREHEIQLLQNLLKEATHGKGTLVLIAGEAGIGKSRLADELGKIAAKEGSRVMFGKCIPGAAVPYLPFQDAFEHIQGADLASTQQVGIKGWLKGSDLASTKHVGVKRWLKGPDLASTRQVGIKGWLKGPEESLLPGLNPKAESERTLHETLEFLRRLATKQPILMILDDLQWADSASTQLLHFLGRNASDLNVLFVGTYRSEELTIEGAEPHPLLENLRIMRREGICHEMFLDRLSQDELKLAIEGMLKGQIDDELLQRIASESAGNPLFAVEVIRLLVHTKSILSQDGVWKVLGKAKIDIPSTVREVILRRIDRLPKDQRRLLDCAAVVGEWFNPSILEEALNLNRLSLLETLDSIDRGSQLIRPTDEVYRFSHEKVRRITYEEISPSRRKELHKIIGQTIERRLPDESLYAELSVHFYNAAEPYKCLKYSLLAGQNCLKMFATPEAIPYFQRVIESTKDDPSLAEYKMKALEGLGDANMEIGLFDSAISFYESFLKLCSDPKDAIRVLRKSSECCLPVNKSNPTKAFDLLNKAEAYGDVDFLEVARIKRIRGVFADFAGRFGDAERYFSEAEKLFEQSGATEELAYTLLEYERPYLAQGRVKEALDKGKRAEQLFSSLKSLEGEANILQWLGQIYFFLGQVNEALQSLTRKVEIEEKSGHYSSLFWSHIYRGLVYDSINDFESAKSEAAKARDYALKTESMYQLTDANAVLAFSEIHLNRIVEGEKSCNDALETVKSIPTDVRGPAHTLVALAHAELLAAKKNWDASNEEFRRCIRLVQGAPGGLILGATVRTRFGEALLKQGLTPEAKEQFLQTVQLYERLENETQAERIKKILADLN
jgi:tetratricopeptide (TPR) repeat protein